MSTEEITRYVTSQKSLHLYSELQQAFIEVLGALPEKQFRNIEKNLIVMAFHQGIVGQVMHFEPREENFIVMQLYIPNDIPPEVLRYVVAHELGHAMQGRNWEETDGMDLEDDATEFAGKIGFPKTEAIAKWLDEYKLR